MKRVLGLLLFGSVGIWLTFPGSPALACTCDVAPLGAHLAVAQTVFRGEVLTVSSVTDRQHVKFRVLLVYKGQPTQFVDVTSATTPDMCGIQFARQTQYLVFAHGDASAYNTSLCNGTTDDLNALDRSGISGHVIEIAAAATKSGTEPAGTRSPLALPVASALLGIVVFAHAQRARGRRKRLARARSRYAGT